MTNSHPSKTMSCEEFQTLLPELLAAKEDVDFHPHVEVCDRCKALIEDLHRIAEAAARKQYGEDRL
ncbi:MAG: hypothetical protein ABR956_02690 [Terracidiphilus sp.]|jgi:hypothetical protein